MFDELKDKMSKNEELELEQKEEVKEQQEQHKDDVPTFDEIFEVEENPVEEVKLTVEKPIVENEKKVEEKPTTPITKSKPTKVKEEVVSEDDDGGEMDEAVERAIEELFDFTGFSHDQSEVVVEEEKAPEPKPKTHLTFHDFEEFPAHEVPLKELGKKKFEDYFEQSRAPQEEPKEKKPVKKKEKKPKRVSRRKRKEIEEFNDIKKRRAYKFKRKKYVKVEDFIKYLNGHYLDLDEIADKVLTDENFHGWLKKRSKRFDESIADFRDIVEIIGN